MLNNSIKVSKLHIIGKKEDRTFRRYTLHVLQFWELFKVSSYSWVAFFSETPCKWYHQLKAHCHSANLVNETMTRRELGKLQLSQWQ